MRAPRNYVFSALAIAAFALWLRAGALHGSLLADDWDHYAMVTGIYPVHRGALDRFDFVANSDADRRALREAGRLPWWSADNLALSVMRPLSSALVGVDFELLDAARAPLRAHLHTFLWWLVLFVATAGLLHELLPAPVALVALAIYALDEAHGLPLSWLANRSELVAIAFATFGIWAHVAHRRSGGRGSPWHATASLALGLLGGEHAFAMLAYVVAFELVGIVAPLRERGRALAPATLLAAAYLGLRSALGYAVAGSAFYADPLTMPWSYLLALTTRLPILLGDLLFGFRAEWLASGPPWQHELAQLRLVPPSWLTRPRLQELQLCVGYLALAGALLAFYALARRRARGELFDTARWLLFAACLALLPMCAAEPMTRLTLPSALGIDVLLALVLATTLRVLRSGSVSQRLAAAVLALLLLAVHGFYAAVHTRAEAAYFSALSRLEEAVVALAPLDELRLPGQHVFVVAASEQTTAWALPYVRAAHGRSRPKSATMLSAEQARPHTLRRLAPNAFELSIEGEPHARSYVGSVYRAAPLRIGQRIVAPRFDVEILELRAAQPTRLRFTFARSLEDASYLFLYSYPDGLRPIPLPSDGQTLRLPSPAR